ncbi:MAG: YceI family protein [Myxococcaceae bacterium]
MRMRRLSWGLLALACATPGLVLAGLQAKQAKVTFSCIGPGGLHFEGTGHELTIADKGDTLLVTVPVASLTTGIGVRDSHMREKYLESDKFPTAELAVPRAGLSLPTDGTSVDATAAGTLSIHGTARPVSFHYKASRSGNTYDVQGDVHINMNDYDIPTPSYLGVTVRPPVDIQVAFRMVDT